MVFVYNHHCHPLEEEFLTFYSGFGNLPAKVFLHNSSIVFSKSNDIF